MKEKQPCDWKTWRGNILKRMDSIAVKVIFYDYSRFKTKPSLEGRLATKYLMSHILADIKRKKPKDFIAAKFHYSLMKLIKQVADSLKIKKIAFSGGVFQNGLLVDLVDWYLSEDYDLYFHQQLSPNDENISFGQLVYHLIQQHKETINQTQVADKVLLDSSTTNF